MLALLLALIVPQPSRAAKPAPAMAEVLETQGLTSLEPQHTNLLVGTKLGEGDRITVMSSSSLRLKLANGDIVRVGPHSDLLLKRNLDGNLLLRLSHGDLLVVSDGGKELDVRASQLKVTTSAKAFYLSKELDHPALICVCDGTAHAKWPFGDARLKGHDHDHPVSINPLEPGVKSVKSSGHTDLDIEALRKLL